MVTLITGGAGFIGCNLAAHLLSKGEDVIIFDNFSRKGSRTNIAWLKESFPKTKVIEGDVTSENDLKPAFAHAPDAVYHLAAQVAVTSSVKDPTADFSINAKGTLNVLEAARTSSCDPVVIYSSTNKVYGAMEAVHIVEKEEKYAYFDIKGINESYPLDFHSPYGCSKGAADQYTRDYARIYGLKTVVFRQSCIYGTRQFGIEDQGWLAWFTIRAILGKPLTIYGNGKQVRDLLFVDDLSTAFQKATKHIHKTKGRIYNIGGGPKNSISLLEAVKLIEEKTGKTMMLSFGEERPGDQKVFICDISKAREDFDWEPTVSPAQGVDAMAAWISRNKELFL